MESGIGSDMLK